MIRSLEEAWEWYSAVKKLIWMMDRISRKYWSEEVGTKSLAETLHRDDKFREVKADEIHVLAKRVMEELDDLAVLLLFSVFEAGVRDRIRDEIDRELGAPPSHLVLQKAIQDAKDTVERGSFSRLTEPYKSLSPDVSMLVDQVRDYRNWVAHGRRGLVTNNIDPLGASDRLKQFLALLDADAAASAPPTPIDPAVASDDKLNSGPTN